MKNVHCKKNKKSFKNKDFVFENLGFQPQVLEIIKRNIYRSRGIILVSGIIGSGKSTTLYSILKILDAQRFKIATIEDAIRYKVKGIDQSRVNSKIGLNFLTSLKSFLRQDSDIIMIDEIQDLEVLKVMTEAVLTGHLILSSINSENVLETLKLLSDADIPNFLIADTINVVISQKLVRKICPHCIQDHNPSKKDINQLKKISDFNYLLEKIDKKSDLSFHKGKGCRKCKYTGYQGKIGIYEVLENSREISGLILKGISLEEIRKQAIKNGMITILEDAFLKAQNGITTIEEILKVFK
jgi:type II secretory ATPase GspE/PulE/Tfp pilus assembly ATPase PilB-like protein